MGFHEFSIETMQFANSTIDHDFENEWEHMMECKREGIPYYTPAERAHADYEMMENDEMFEKLMEWGAKCAIAFDHHRNEKGYNRKEYDRFGWRISEIRVKPIKVAVIEDTVSEDDIPF